MKTNVYQIVTDRIVEQMEKGIIPWHKPWSCVGGEGWAISYTTRKPYSFLNQLLLGKGGEWLTFNQVKNAGGSIRKGAKSGFVVFYQQSIIKEQVVNENGEKEEKEFSVPVLRWYHVFHIDDCVGVESKIEVVEPSEEIEPIEVAENIIEGYLTAESELTFQNDKPSDKAYYTPSRDMVVVPMLTQYEVAEEYYSTTFHELIHSTMTESRCNRKAMMKNAAFGSEDYSLEELVAEIGSAMLVNICGISTEKAFTNSVAYIQGWAKALKKNPKAIVWASARAEKAARYIQGER